MSRKMYAFDDYYCRRRRLVACNATCVCVCFEERERDPQTATNQKDEGETETAVMRSKHVAAAPRVSIFLFFVCVLNREDGHNILTALIQAANPRGNIRKHTHKTTLK